jgi:hypothetical protein
MEIATLSYAWTQCSTKLGDSTLLLSQQHHDLSLSVQTLLRKREGPVKTCLFFQCKYLGHLNNVNCSSINFGKLSSHAVPISSAKS